MPRQLGVVYDSTRTVSLEALSWVQLEVCIILVCTLVACTSQGSSYTLTPPFPWARVQVISQKDWHEIATLYPLEMRHCLEELERHLHGVDYIFADGEVTTATEFIDTQRQIKESGMDAVNGARELEGSGSEDEDEDSFLAEDGGLLGMISKRIASKKFEEVQKKPPEPLHENTPLVRKEEMKDDGGLLDDDINRVSMEFPTDGLSQHKTGSLMVGGINSDRPGYTI